MKTGVRDRIIASVVMIGPAQADMMPSRQAMEEGAETSDAAARSAESYLGPIVYARTERFGEASAVNALEPFAYLTDAAVVFTMEASGSSADIGGAGV